MHDAEKVGNDRHRCEILARENGGLVTWRVRMKYAIFLALFFLIADASASSVMFGKHLVSKGDAIGSVRDAAGTPNKVDKIDADDSSPAMEIWTYNRAESIVTIWIVDRKVVQVQEQQAIGSTAKTSPASK